ncbi:NUDIX domain-containing protein [Streptomyces viridosporus]|uniref:NUDIX domain-containing protein n=1 Tax=Streptomyces viridosporus TaxID=67581 RepID=UPI00331BACA2
MSELVERVDEFDRLVGGAVEVGESYAEAAARELVEERGVRAPVRHVFTFLCRGAISPYWLAVHEAVVVGISPRIRGRSRGGGG